MLALAYWGGAALLAGLAIVALGDCGTGPAPDDLEVCLAQGSAIRWIVFGIALVGFPFFIWRLRKEKGPL
ncbi:MAG TPA: hypothetical protein VF138_09530 [Caulobacteraceae bacterium]